MKVSYWGTAAAEGIPAVYCSCDLCSRARSLGGKDLRTRSQMLVDEVLLIDMGPDTCAHAQRYSFNLMDIPDILVTHSHSDHFYAEDLIFRAEPYGHGGLQHPVTLHGNQRTRELLQWVVSQYNDTDCFERAVQYNLLKPFDYLETATHGITALPTNHDVNEDCMIFDIVSLVDGKRLLYGNDSAFFPPETIAYLAKHRFDLISLDCTMGGHDSCTSHMTMSQCAKLAKLLRAQHTADTDTTIVVNHFSHNNGLLHDELVTLAASEGFVVAYDGMSVVL